MVNEVKQPKILFLDIETFPNVAYVWGKWQQDVIRFLKETCIATFVAKWLGNDKIISRSLPDFKGYKPGSYDDKALVQEIWNLLNEADIVVAHNGDDFDVRTCNGRFIVHSMTPPKPFKTVDTKKVAARVARFNSNKLDDLGSLLVGERKIKTDFDLWEGCINGDKKSWDKMLSYNKKDVLLLESIYLRLRPWIKDHPNFTRGEISCPKCGSTKLQNRGLQVAITRTYQRYQCQNCGGWLRSVKSEKSNAAQVTNT